MGGEIEVKSEPGEGTVFSVYLPRLQAASDVPGKTEIADLEKGTEKILLVDDEEPIVRFESRLLEKLGYMVTSKTSSTEALELFHEDPRKFDLVITDMNMPRMTGDQLAISMMDIRPDIPIVICTGFSEKISPEVIQKIGIKGFLMKPVTTSDLSQTIRNVLDSSKVST